MRARMRSARPGARSRGFERRLRVVGGRTWPAPVLALLVGLLVVLCAWFLARSSGPPNERLGVVGLSQGVVSRHGVPPIEPPGTPTEFPARATVAELEPPDSEPCIESDVALPETLVYGSLVDSLGAPIQGACTASVTFVDHTGRRRAVDAKLEGAFALRSLEFGSYWVTASADGYRSVEETLELSPNGPLMRKDFELRKSVELRIKVTTPDGKNLLDVLSASGAPSGARLLVPIATRELPGRRFDELVGCLNDKFGVGHFENYGARAEKLATEYMGVLLLDCDLPVYVSLVCHNVVLQTKLVGGGQDEVTFVQSPEDLLASLATIRVHVVDSTTELPIERARVMLRGGTYSSEGVATDQQGIATIDRREPGLFDLQVSAKGYAKFRTSIDALPGEVADLGTIELEREVTVEGRVFGPEDHALAMPFSLGVLDPSDRSIRWFRQDGFTSREDGTFELRGLGRAEYVIRTSNHDAVNRGEWEGLQCMSGNVPIDTRTGPISGLEVRLRPASRLVLHFTGRVADGMRLRVVDEDGIELVASVVKGSEPRSLELPAGRYSVSVLDSRGSVLSVQAVALGSETVELDLAR